MEKDEKEIWCNEKGFSIENIAGDGNCLYTCLGRSRKLTGDRVRTIIHENTELLWDTIMHHDNDKKEIEDFKTKTMDKTEWGQYEHIIFWSRIYHLTVQIYSHNMPMQIIDGDEYMKDKETIRLLYSNKNKWGDAENHYDLMHDISQKIKKTRCYERRSEEEQ